MGEGDDARYLRRLRAWERLTSAVTSALLEALALTPGERLLDVGCGAGHATLRAAGIVGPRGHVVGVDISSAATAWASARAAKAGISNVSFEVGDAQTARIGGGPFDAAMSQFGVMFFSDPVAAFANIRAHLAPGGRLCFACWQEAGKNPWSFAAALAGIAPPPPEPAAGKSPTGPFALADPSHVSAVLDTAGFADIRVASGDTAVEVPENTVMDDEELAAMGVPAERVGEARAVLEPRLARLREPSGLSKIPLAYLIVTARA